MRYTQGRVTPTILAPLPCSSEGQMNEDSAMEEITLRLGSDKFDEDDEHWHSQQARFFAELRREVGTVQLKGTSAPGSKGAVESLILTLGSAGVLQAASSCFRAWLARDRTRRIELSWTSDGGEERIVLEGKAVDDAT